MSGSGVSRNYGIIRIVTDCCIVDISATTIAEPRASFRELRRGATSGDFVQGTSSVIWPAASRLALHPGCSRMR